MSKVSRGRFSQILRILDLQKILAKRWMTMEKIQVALAKKHSAQRRTLYRDLEVLDLIGLLQTRCSNTCSGYEYKVRN